MNYTDDLFPLPIRVYDQFSIRKADKREEDLDQPTSPDWVAGVVDIPLEEVVGFGDFFDSGRAAEDIADEGFDGTIVFTRSMGEFTCILQRKELKRRLNEFSKKLLEMAMKDLSQEEGD